MSEPIDRLIDRLIGNLEALRPELHAAEDLLTNQRRRIDSYIAHSTDDPHVAGGDNTSRTEAAALSRIAIDERLRSHREELDAATLTIRNLRRDCQAAARREGEAFAVDLPPVPTCNPTGREGAREWGDFGCANVPSRGPLCDRCAKAEYRWRQRNGLPPRRDGLFAGDLDDRATA